MTAPTKRTEIPLRDCLKEYSQTELAKVLGCTQGAVWQMLTNNREIYIVMEKGRPVSGYEIKRFAPADKD